jgi:hypothetical protein
MSAFGIFRAARQQGRERQVLEQTGIRTFSAIFSRPFWAWARWIGLAVFYRRLGSFVKTWL